MTIPKKQNAVRALLAEYGKAINELQQVIASITDGDLTATLEPVSEDNVFKTLQAILTHVVSSGYSYCIYIKQLRGFNEKRPEKILLFSIEEYRQVLDELFTFTCESFIDISDAELEEFEDEKKIKTSWGQLYDIEQIMEHAIVHILRHRLQIEKIKLILKNKPH
ncbi:MAG: DinB family protein [Ferruginibacter sp.]